MGGGYKIVRNFGHCHSSISYFSALRAYSNNFIQVSIMVGGS